MSQIGLSQTPTNCWIWLGDASDWFHAIGNLGDTVYSHESTNATSCKEEAV